jgi:mRNA-degrading endonuclease YafQ of YafQ-DinJ toxin-antitoxin module
MRIIKLGLISFVFIFVIITLISLLIPAQIRISRATNLPNQRDSIFSLLKQEETWHPAYRDSAASAHFKSIKRTAALQTDSTLLYTLQQEDRKPVNTGWQLYGAPSSDSLTLQWFMDFQLRWYPWEKFSTLFYESTYGRMMESGLANFKKELAE